MNIQITTIENFLGSLNEIELVNSPAKFYACGDTTLFKRYMSVSIIGARKATEEGIKRARFLARAIVKRGGIVVSGLAEGIDTAAHRAAIQVGGRTVGVIGTPLEQVYPKKNTDLQKEIAKNHLLISQFPNGEQVKPKNFLIRNRTMALLSDATVIVEAGEKSGTIHQGWEAIRLGRPLFIMESLANSRNLSWPKELMSYGAEILTRDLLPEFLDLLPSEGRSREVVF